MITIIAIIFGWFLFVKAIKGIVRRNHRKREARAEVALQREIDRLRRLEEADHADIIQVQMEQIRAAKEAERIAREQARQAEILRKHEERIAKLEYRMSKAEDDILYLTETVETLETLRHPLAMELQKQKNQRWKNQKNGIEDARLDKSIADLTKKVIQYDSKIHSARQKISKAEFDKAEAERQLSAA